MELTAARPKRMWGVNDEMVENLYIPKIAVIDDADYLNAEGANSLLKTLEEPPPRSVLILIGTSPEHIFSFMIRAPAILVLVRVQYVTSLYLPVADDAEHHRDLIALLRLRCSPAGAEL